MARSSTTARHYVATDQRRIGYVPQDGSLFPHLSVEQNVGFGLRRRDRRGSNVAELLEMVGLAGLERRYPHQLSGGQQQRVALARALAIAPALVLLDEPFSSLDASLRATVRHDVRRVLREAGTTAILVTHDQDEALSLADRVAIIQRWPDRPVRPACGPLHAPLYSRARPWPRRVELSARDRQRRWCRDPARAPGTRELIGMRAGRS